MRVPDGATLLATVCNATPNAVPYALWLARGEQQYLVDLSDALGQAGDSGLTGLTCQDDMIYAAVQSDSAPRILILDRHLVPAGVITSPHFSDLHSIHAAGDALIVCSTGARSVIRVDLADHRTTMLWQFDGKLHHNSACLDAGELVVCCHYPSVVVPHAVGGGVINPVRGRVMLAGLSQPHSLLATGEAFLVLDSDGHRVVQFDRVGIQRQRVLSGFLRGIARCGGSLFIASSAGRLISRKHPVVPAVRQYWDMAAERVCLHELDAATFEVKGQHFPLVAGFEIYELLSLPVLDPPSDRLVVPDIYAMARSYYEATKRALVQPR